MVAITSLVIPILISAVIVFIASSIVHMATPWHKHDMRRLPNEDAAMNAIRTLALPPGDYCMPLADSMEAMKSPEFIKKMKQGPVMFMTVLPAGEMKMGANLAMWFAYSVVISVFAAYVAGRALGPGAHYLRVFQFAGCVAFMGYAMALPQDSIWWKRGWGFTLRSMIDGLLYGALTAGTFGWLWPR